jgi:hypothetical protein
VLFASAEIGSSDRQVSALARRGGRSFRDNQVLCFDRQPTIRNPPSTELPSSSWRLSSRGRASCWRPRSRASTGFIGSGLFGEPLGSWKGLCSGGGCMQSRQTLRWFLRSIRTAGASIGPILAVVSNTRVRSGTFRDASALSPRRAGRFVSSPGAMLPPPEPLCYRATPVSIEWW